MTPVFRQTLLEWPGLRRAIFITQQLGHHPMYAAAVAKANALANRVDELIVVADRVDPTCLATNARAHTFGAPFRLVRGARYLSSLVSELRPRPIVAIAHMVPLYGVVAGPILRPFGVPLVLWYTHWHDHRVLRASEPFCTAITSVDARSFPYESRKVHGTGHGIDLTEFPLVDGAPSPPGTLRAVVAGRYAKRKGLPQILRALRIVRDRGLDVTLEMRGPTMTPDEERVRREIGRLAGELRFGDELTLGGMVAREDLPALFATADVVICNHISPDKIIYEGAASGVPVLASHPAFDELFEGIEPSLMFEHDDSDSLADRLAALLATPPEQRRAIGRKLHERVADHHSVDTWADAMLSHARNGRSAFRTVV